MVDCERMPKSHESGMFLMAVVDARKLRFASPNFRRNRVSCVHVFRHHVSFKMIILALICENLSSRQKHGNS